MIINSSQGHRGINWLASAYELQHYFSIARPKLIVVDPQFRDRVENALNASPKISPKRPVVQLGGDSPDSVRVYLRLCKQA